MVQHRRRICVARRDPSVGETDFVDLQAGYIQRAAELLPRGGDRAPWRLRQNYLLDLLKIRYGRIEDGVLQFS